MSRKKDNNYLMGWVKIPAAAAYMGLSTRTVRTLLSEGLPFSRLRSGTILLSIDQVDQYLKKYEIKNNAVDEIVDDVIRNFK